ncbi:MAG: hypothetical protein IPL40_08115 [Proteobacteria bacterium]|nr:hypothetical protein [Pseudomonadota bacterium]
MARLRKRRAGASAPAPSPPPSSSSARAQWLLPLLAALPLSLLALRNHSVFWPDEIFQTLEPAHRAAFGYGFVSWEFTDGARSWLFPGAIAWLWRAAAALGVTQAETLLALARLLLAACSVAALYFALRLAGHWAGARAVWLAGLLALAFPPLLFFGWRSLTEVPSAALLCAGAWYAAPRAAPTPGQGPRRALLAGLLTGLAVFLRFQNGLVVVGLLGWLLAQRRGREAAFLAAGAIVIAALVGGLLDWLSWGAPFHAFRRYLSYNLLEGRASAYGVSPASFYLTTLSSAAGLALTVALAAGLGGALLGRARGVALLVAGFVVIHSLVPHKELRFIVPVLPLWLAVAASGLLGLGDRLSPRWLRRPPTRSAVIALGLLLAASGAWRATRLTQLDLGQHPLRPEVGVSPWAVTAAVNALLLEAGQRPDLCGLGLLGTQEIWSGGYSYLHRDVPLFTIVPQQVIERGTLGAEGRAANYLVAHRGLAALATGWRPIATRAEWVLLQRDGLCGPPPPSYSRVFPRG